MQLAFNCFNHSEVGQRSLEDIMMIMGAQMKALGHRIVWEKDNKRFVGAGNGYNLLFEGFGPNHAAIVAAAHAQGARFIIVATEEPTYTGNPAAPGSWRSLTESGKALFQSTWEGFNQGTQNEMIWRMKTFPDAAQHADGILCLVPGDHVVGWYNQFAPSAQVELGYAPELVRGDVTPPEFDFGFYGSYTPRRERLLKKLARMTTNVKAVKVVADFAPQIERDKAMQRAKVIIQVRKFDKMGLVSSSRCSTALCLGRPVIAEPHLLSHPWDKIVRFSDTLDGFFAEALGMRAMWRGIHADQMAKFKKMLSPEFCVGNALREIGIADERVAA